MSARNRSSRAPFVRTLLLVWVCLGAGFVRGTFAQDSSDYVIGADDVLSVTVFDQADLSGKYAVASDGLISFPMIGRVKAGGMTLRDFELEIQKRLADGFFRDPHVSVGVEQYRSQRIFVMGEVRTPGTYPLTGGMTLIEALARAGATPTGDVIIVHPREAKGPTLPGQDQTSEVTTIDIHALQSGSLAQNVNLRDGDTLFVPRADTLYVFGQVRSPGAYAVQKNTSVLQALSLAGGVTDNGAMNRIRIVRLVDNKKAEIKVKLNDVVQPGDTLIVPERYF